VDGDRCRSGALIVICAAKPLSPSFTADDLVCRTVGALLALPVTSVKWPGR